MNHNQFNHELLNLQNKLDYYAIRLTSAADQADDLLQDTLVKAIIFRDKFRSDTNFKAWVYTIMKNTFINEYHRWVKTRNIFDCTNHVLHLLFSKDKVYPAPDSLYITSEIQHTIDSLKDEFRVPFNLFIEGYRYKEIAERLDLPLGTVKSRIFFTRKKLVKSLSDYSYA
ncbi:MAG: sigma-70 family RNA polymerase sigma factor [Bacteroidota bacterium]